jgi:hypothetical protein
MTAKYLFPSMAAFLFLSCNSEEIGNSKDVAPETIYSSYTITYTEGEPTVNCIAQFRFAGEEGTTLVLSDSSRVQLDAETILIDSSKFRGAYYETEKPMPSFTGLHTWRFRDINSKNYDETFRFAPISLQTDLPAVIKPADLLLHFNEVTDGDSIFISISDTSKSSSNDEIKYSVSHGSVLIPATLFKNLHPGELHFFIYLIRQQTLQHSPKEGGKMIQVQYLKEKKCKLEL